MYFTNLYLKVQRKSIIVLLHFSVGCEGAAEHVDSPAGVRHRAPGEPGVPRAGRV